MSEKNVKEHLAHFPIAGFTYYDGAEVFQELQMGMELAMELEPGNAYDARAVMIKYKDYKLGYVPRSENRILYKLLKVGLGDQIHVRIQRLNMQDYPEQQVHVVAHLVGKLLSTRPS